MASADVSELRESILRWANDAASSAMDALGQKARDAAPYGLSEDPRKSGGHLVDTMEAIITSEGEHWSGELAFTADYASFVDEGRGAIEGNPLLWFYWEGHLIGVPSVGPQEANPFFSDNVNEDTWTDALDSALDSTPLA